MPSKPEKRRKPWPPYQREYRDRATESAVTAKRKARQLAELIRNGDYVRLEAILLATEIEVAANEVLRNLEAAGAPVDRDSL
jgi:hypothetical protein